jgi:hypothetical protein
MDSGQKVASTTTTDADPWNKDQLEDIQGLASDQYDNRKNMYKPYSGSVLAPTSTDTRAGRTAMRNIAEGGNSLAREAYSEGRSVLKNDGLNSGLNSVLGNLSGFARGDYQEDPRLLAMLDTNSARIGQQVNSSMSGAGRYGSFAHGSELADRIGENINPIMFQANEAARGRQMQANQMMGGIYDSGLNRAANVMGMVPELDANRYSSAERLMGLGAMTDQRAQTLRDAEIQRWNINQSRDAEALARYAGISQGLGALGGSQLSTTTKPAPSLFQQMLGFGGAGLSLLK